MRFEVNDQLCSHCGACIATCPADMVRDKRGSIKISHVACINCGHCMAICPTGAITLRDDTGGGPFEPLPAERATAEQLLGTLKTRRTTRRYLPEPVKREDLERLLEAARWVPSGANCQCQQFTVITSPEKRDHVRQQIMDYYRQCAETFTGSAGGGSQGQMLEHILAAVPSFVKHVDAGRDRLFFDAPAVILVHAPRHEVLPEAACAFATLAITLMADTIGLGTCITAYASMALQALPEMAAQVGVPEENVVHYVVVVGKPAEKYELVPPRRPAQVTWL